MPVTHQIKDFEVDLSFQSRASARRTVAEIRTWLEHDLMQQLDELFSRYSPGREALRLDTIRLDCGALTAGNYKSVIQQRLFHELEKQISSQLLALDTSISFAVEGGESQDDTALSQFVGFVRSGQLPWHRTRSSNDLHQQLFSRITDHDNLAALLQSAAATEPVVARLARQFPESQLSVLLAQLAPRLLPMAIAMLDLVELAGAAQLTGATAFAELNARLWTRLLQMALAARQAPPAPELARELLGIVVAQAGVPEPALAAAFARTAVQAGWGSASAEHQAVADAAVELAAKAGAAPASFAQVGSAAPAVQRDSSARTLDEAGAASEFIDAAPAGMAAAYIEADPAESADHAGASARERADGDDVGELRDAPGARDPADISERFASALAAQDVLMLLRHWEAVAELDGPTVRALLAAQLRAPATWTRFIAAAPDFLLRDLLAVLDRAGAELVSALLAGAEAFGRALQRSAAHDDGSAALSGNPARSEQGPPAARRETRFAGVPPAPGRAAAFTARLAAGRLALWQAVFAGALEMPARAWRPAELRAHLLAGDPADPHAYLHTGAAPQWFDAANRAEPRQILAMREPDTAAAAPESTAGGATSERNRRAEGFEADASIDTLDLLWLAQLALRLPAQAAQDDTLRPAASQQAAQEGRAGDTSSPAQATAANIGAGPAAASMHVNRAAEPAIDRHARVAAGLADTTAPASSQAAVAALKSRLLNTAAAPAAAAERATPTSAIRFSAQELAALAAAVVEHTAMASMNLSANPGASMDLNASTSVNASTNTRTSVGTGPNAHPNERSHANAHINADGNARADGRTDSGSGAAGRSSIAVAANATAESLHAAGAAPPRARAVELLEAALAGVEGEQPAAAADLLLSAASDTGQLQRLSTKLRAHALQVSAIEGSPADLQRLLRHYLLEVSGFSAELAQGIHAAALALAAASAAPASIHRQVLANLVARNAPFAALGKAAAAIDEPAGAQRRDATKGAGGDAGGEQTVTKPGIDQRSITSEGEYFSAIDSLETAAGHTSAMDAESSGFTDLQDLTADALLALCTELGLRQVSPFTLHGPDRSWLVLLQTYTSSVLGYEPMVNADFFAAIHRHAARARHLERYYQNILACLVAQLPLDLEELEAIETPLALASPRAQLPAGTQHEDEPGAAPATLRLLEAHTDADRTADLSGAAADLRQTEALPAPRAATAGAPSQRTAAAPSSASAQAGDLRARGELTAAEQGQFGHADAAAATAGAAAMSSRAAEPADSAAVAAGLQAAAGAEQWLGVARLLVQDKLSDAQTRQLENSVAMILAETQAVQLRGWMKLLADPRYRQGWSTRLPRPLLNRVILHVFAPAAASLGLPLDPQALDSHAAPLGVAADLYAGIITARRQPARGHPAQASADHAAPTPAQPAQREAAPRDPALADTAGAARTPGNVPPAGAALDAAQAGASADTAAGPLTTEALHASGMQLAQLLVQPLLAAAEQAELKRLVDTILREPSAANLREWLKLLAGPRLRQGLIAHLPGHVLTRLMGQLAPAAFKALDAPFRLVLEALGLLGIDTLAPAVEQARWQFMLARLFGAADAAQPADLLPEITALLATAADLADSTQLQALVARRKAMLLKERQRAALAPQALATLLNKAQPAATLANGIHLDNAGMVLAAPYMPRLFAMLKLTAAGRFVDQAAAERGLHLLQFLVTGQGSSPEYKLLLNKILCGVSPGFPVAAGTEVAADEQALIEQLLLSMIQHWKILGSTTIAGLRETFLQRQGWLRQDDNAWHLEVKSSSFDMLLDQIPWNYSLIKFTWMTKPIHVSWRNTAGGA